MILTRACLYNPTALLALLILCLIFGGISLSKLPIQLTPELEEPEITITTRWRAAAPNEIEAEIIEPQEEVLRGLPNLTKITAKARQNQGQINLTFMIGSDMRRALIEVLNRLNQVSNYPDDVDDPTISTVGQNARAIAWFVIRPAEGNLQAIKSYQNFVEDTVQSRFERIPGVARSEIYGGSDKELRITFDPYKAAQLGIELDKVITLASTNKDISAGSVDIGKRQYNLRFSGKYELNQLGEMIIAWQNDRPIYLSDVATFEEHLIDDHSFVITKGGLSLAINAQREIGVNVLQVMQGLKKAAQELSEGPLKRANLTIEQVYDETVYIEQSIKMLRNNLGLGIILAIGILFLFLLRFKATLIVAVSIPICLVTSFSIISFYGLTLNVISLAGLALAIGMILDASIIVLENIIRKRESQQDPFNASIDGTKEVWGALFSSTATTVAIFLPVVFLDGEVGQLFADLAVAICIAIVLSLIVAITIVPTATYLLFSNQRFNDPYSSIWQSITHCIMKLTDTATRRIILIVLLAVLSSATTFSLKPKADYLPNGNQNLAFAFILPPPGANITTLKEEMGTIVADRMQAYVDGDTEPEVKHYFFVATDGNVFMGARAKKSKDIQQLVSVINSVVQGFPDSIAFARQASLFRGFSSGRTIDMHLKSSHLPDLMDSALNAFLLLKQKYTNILPRPGLQLANPEFNFQPKDRRLAEIGWNRSTLAAFIQTLGNGLYIGDYFNGEETLNIILRASPWYSIGELNSIPMMTKNAGVVPLNETVYVKQTAGPEEILRVNRRRTVTLEISPPADTSLETTLEYLKTDIEPKILAQMPDDAEIEYGGVSDKLTTALKSMQGSFFLAIVILYLLMSAIFRSFKDSLFVLVTIPLAVSGGVLGLYIMNLMRFQSMDLLTMIGFIILLGLVVNNAILLVYQTRVAERDGVSRRNAVNQAILLRIRPIMMSTLTSIFGMLPLLLIPGAGTELYLGLACVIVGGMGVSTLFTLIVLPCLLRIGEVSPIQNQDNYRYGR